MSYGSHTYVADPRNADVLINIDGTLLPRSQAMVSIFDAGFLMGDGVWEGLRVHGGQVAFWQDHASRLKSGLMALDIELGISFDALHRRILDTLAANHMKDDVHIRLMVTRGLKSTPYQDPRVAIGAATIVIAAEHKKAAPQTPITPLKLYTVHVRRGRPDVQDPGLNSHSKINCITSCIQAIKAGADEALMLDPQGFVATCNSTHFFIIRNNEVWTSTGDYCLSGITRMKVIELCRENTIPVFEKNFSLLECYSADEAFTTGTFAGLAPVGEIDGRLINTGTRGPLTKRLQHLYQNLITYQ